MVDENSKIGFNQKKDGILTGTSCNSAIADIVWMVHGHFHDHAHQVILAMMGVRLTQSPEFGMADVLG